MKYIHIIDVTHKLNNMISKNMTNWCSLNVNGIHGREKRNRVVEWIKAHVFNSFFTGSSFRGKY